MVALDRSRVDRRRLIFAVAAGGALVGLTGAALLPARRNECADPSGQATAIWNADSRALVASAFQKTKAPYSESAFSEASRRIDVYLSSWAEQYREACQATNVRHEQSEEALDLRMQCLRDRLGNARVLIEIFSHADRAAVEHAVNAATELPTLDSCADIAVLRGVRHRRDDAMRPEIEQVEADAGRVRVLSNIGNYRAALALASEVEERTKRFDAEPLFSESLRLDGVLNAKLDAFDAAATKLERIATDFVSPNQVRLQFVFPQDVGYTSAR